ncbi:macrophage mannose receptor 1-like [Sardina pilchardus]|uniref:macrophage mannose receptor 1-like n=1 Tax=Sardina pilchardus TaxID=27697 RepID=UPI002E0ED776
MMTLILIATLLFSGVCSLSSSVPRQFYKVKKEKNWTEAQQYCREKFTDLATIDNTTENEKVKSIIGAGVDLAWIGLKQRSSPKWQWSLAARDLHRENETEFTNWRSGEPNGVEDNCVTLMYRKWNDAHCSHPFFFICYDERDSTQPYVEVTVLKNWIDAQKYCREKHTDLASERNKEEHDQIDKVRKHEPVWIGLFREPREWSDGSTTFCSFCNPSAPSSGGGVEGLCAAITPSSQWNYEKCSRRLNFICYEEKLVLVHENKTWKEALQYCREHHVDLVSVTSEQIQSWVSQLVKRASTAHVWLGLLHSYGVGWYWVYGQTVCYSNWAQGHGQVESFKYTVGAAESGWGMWVSNLTKTDKLNFICTNEEQ